MEALKSNILVSWVVNSDPSVHLRPWRSTPNEVSTFVVGDFPVIVPVVDVEGSVIGSPVFKGNPEDTNILISVAVSLFSVVSSPEIRVLGPWTVVVVSSPWVSHLDKFLSIMSSTCKFDGSEYTISMTRDHVVVRNLASSTHVVVVFNTIGNVCPNLVVAQVSGLVSLGWLTGHDSHGFSWGSSVDTNVVDIKFSHGFFKDL